MGWIILVFSVLANAAASMLVKAGMSALPTGDGRLRSALLSPWLWSGVVLYGLAFATYAVALRLFPLNLVHPLLTAGAIGLVAIGSVVIFHEALPVSAILGLVLLVVGVALVAIRPF